MRVLFLSIMVLISGCAADPSSCDPRRGGFFDGLGALATDCYSQRVHLKHNELSSSQVLTQQLQSENRQLVQQDRLTSTQLKDAQRQIASLKSTNTRLQKGLKRVSSTGTPQSEKARLQQRLNNVMARTDDLARDISRSQVDLKTLEREKNSLEQEQESLMQALTNAELL